MDIDELNVEIRSCIKCGLAETRTQVLCGEGNLHAKLFLIAQAPGETEDKVGRMFVGPSGKVLDELLGYAEIDRGTVYMTNLIKCILPRCRKPKMAEIDACSYYLNKEIEIVNPDVLVPLGYYATRYVFDRYSFPQQSRQEFHGVFGRLFLASEMGIFPLRHPASALFHGGIRELMMDNYRKLRILYEDCVWYPECPMKRFYDAGRLDRVWIDRYCKGDWENCVRYHMEEDGVPHPDCMLPDGTIDRSLLE